jgi:hypothetical protein
MLGRVTLSVEEITEVAALILRADRRERAAPAVGSLTSAANGARSHHPRTR